MNLTNHPAVYQVAGLILDASRTPFDFQTIAERFAGREAELIKARDDLFAGAAVNPSENRAALHWLLRGNASSKASTGLPQARFNRQRDAFLELAGQIAAGTLPGEASTAIKTVVQIGTGGSSLGPRVIADALALGKHPKVQFLSAPDPKAWAHVVSNLEPESTVFLVVSKSFGTAEVMANAKRARTWLSGGLPTAGVDLRMIAVTANPERARAGGYQTILEFDDTIGGRFSWASAVGLGAAIALGRDRFEALLAGAAAMDQHFSTEPVESNLPVLAALLDQAVRQHLNHGLRAVIGYGHGLRHLAEHIQQVEMESTGKPSLTGESDLHPWLIPGAGPDAEHAFFQALHQSPLNVPSEFVGALRVDGKTPPSLLHLLGQADALWQGQDHDDLQQHCPGRRPASLVLMPELSPTHLGALLAFQEHKTYITATLLGVNAFDQYGVELGKRLRRELEESSDSSETRSTSQALLTLAQSEKFIP